MEEGKRRRVRNTHVTQFNLMLTYHATFGESTLVMCFNLKYLYDRLIIEPHHLYGQALVVCTFNLNAIIFFNLVFYFEKRNLLAICSYDAVYIVCAHIISNALLNFFPAYLSSVVSP